MPWRYIQSNGNLIFGGKVVATGYSGFDAGMHLTPEDGTDTHGRGGFLIHGDSLQHTGSASHGCIILPRPTRMEIAASEDRELEVI
jgi:hypothetical protein